MGRGRGGGGEEVLIIYRMSILRTLVDIETHIFGDPLT